MNAVTKAEEYYLCKVQLVFTRERLFMPFIREGLFIVFTEERSFLLSDLHVQCIKVLYYFYTSISHFVLYFSCLNGCVGK